MVLCPHGSPEPRRKTAHLHLEMDHRMAPQHERRLTANPLQSFDSLIGVE